MTIIDKKLKESEERFKALFKGGLFPTYAWQKTGNSFKLIDFNTAAETITQGNVSKFLGITASEMYKDRSDILDDLNKCFKEKTNIIKEMKYSFSAVEKEKDLLVTYSYIPPDSVLVHTEDITDRKNAEQKIKESEEKYHSIFNNMTEGFAYHEVIVDNNNKPIDYKYIEVNPSFEKLTGLKADDMIGKKVTEILPGTENDPADWIGKFGNVGLTGVPLTVEDYSEALDRWYKVSGYSPKKGYFAVTFSDITEQKKSEIALNSEKQFVNDILNASMDTVFVFNPESGKAVRWNDQFKQVSGYSVEEIALMKAPDSYYNEEDLKRAAEATKNVLEKGTITVEMSFITKEGRSIPYEYSATTLENSSGETLIVSVGRDMSERRIAEQRIKDSEQKFRDLYEEAPNAYLSIAPDKSILRVNKAAERLLGYNEGDFLKMSVFDLYPDTDHGLKRAKEIFEKFITGESIKDVELQMINKERKPIWVSLSVKPIFDSNGNVIESRSMILDINERKIAQEEVKKSYNRLEELEYIINNSPGVVFLWKNSEGWPVEFVSENVDQWGYTPDDFYSGKVTYEEIIYPDDLQRVAEEVEVYSNEDVNNFDQEYRILTKSGEIRWLDDRSWIRRDSNGEITHYQGIVLDITDRKIAEEALRLSEKKYKEAYDRGNFYKDLFAHDINNILQVINSSAELITYQLGESEKSKEIESISEIIIKQVNRGSKLISNVRTLSELEEKEIITQRVEIGAFLKNSITFVEKAYEERNVNISISSINGNYFTNANDLLQDVFENVLINGIKYNENPNVEISIKISKQEIDEKDYFKIEFIDNGIGVADNRKKVIFMSGNRALKGSKGMGLGLSLVNKILQIFKGKIWVEDKVKGDYTKGSNFIILLPEVK